MEDDKSTLVAPRVGFSNVSGMVIGCVAAALVIMVMVSVCCCGRLGSFLSKPVAEIENIRLESTESWV